MNVFLATDYRVVSYNGRIYGYNRFQSILKRYSHAFGEITLCTRCLDCKPNDKYIDITDDIKKFIPINLRKALFCIYDKDLKTALAGCDLVIGRYDSVIAFRAASIARKMGIPTMAEIMADPWDGYWNHGLIGKLLAPYMYYANKRAIFKSNYATYVTDYFLQCRYPCKGISINASNVQLPYIDDLIKDIRIDKIINKTNFKKLTLITTAAVNVYAKGQEFVIRAIPKLQSRGFDIKYKLVGGGSPERLKKIAKKLGVEDCVEFLGEQNLDFVLKTIDQSDIYIQPSLQEGLPRAVIEALSRACPVIGTRTAGTPELINEECVVDRKSSDDIVRAICTIANKEKFLRLADNNFNRASDFKIDILDDRRNNFFDRIKSEIQK